MRVDLRELVCVRTVRLTCSEFYVDARLTAVEGRWLASADAPDGPSIGTGETPVDALMKALEAFDGDRRASRPSATGAGEAGLTWWWWILGLKRVE
jgi:hypothetical protein